jgi:hypothetical protein
MKLVAAMLSIFYIAGCAETGLKHDSPDWYRQHRQDWESWDQEHLKANDHGCPSAVFIAPGGDLIECEIPRPKIVDDVVQIVSKLPPTTYDTSREAAVYALANAYHLSHYYEVGGVITRLDDGSYGIGRPSTLWAGDHVEVDHNPLNVRGTIVADYHTHPCNKFTHVPNLLSPQDVVDNLEHNVIGYMADLCTGKVVEFDPSSDKINPLELPDGYDARDVGQITVDGVVLDSEEARELL